MSIDKSVFINPLDIILFKYDSPLRKLTRAFPSVPIIEKPCSIASDSTPFKDFLDKE